MKALILNSGMGIRMGSYTADQPKCMTELLNGETILERQLKLLSEAGIKDIVITTGYFNNILVEYSESLGLSVNYDFVFNPIYDKTNYIYSIYCARDLLYNEDVLLIHGDLVFCRDALKKVLDHNGSCMKVSSTLPLPEKDFKAVVHDGKVKKVGVEFFDNAMEAQAMYKLDRSEWNAWLDRIVEFCESGRRGCYAEVALNEITDECIIDICDVKDDLCTEVDTPEDLEKVLELIANLNE